MKLDNLCPHCGRYIVKYGDGANKFRYSTRKVYKDLWRKIYGSYPLGRFYKSKCPVCKRHLAVFEDLRRKELVDIGPIVLYLCTLSDRPFDQTQCNNSSSCYKCGFLKTQREAGLTLWYKRKRDDSSQTQTS